MNDPWWIAGSFAAGLLLGAAFLAGLWATIRRLGRARHALVWMLGSLLARFSLVLAGFYFLASLGWQHILAGAAGFALARVLVVRRVDRQDAQTEAGR